MIVRYLLSVNVAGLMAKEKLEPSAILLGATQVTVGLITAVAVISRTYEASLARTGPGVTGNRPLATPGSRPRRPWG